MQIDPQTSSVDTAEMLLNQKKTSELVLPTTRYASIPTAVVIPTQA